MSDNGSQPTSRSFMETGARLRIKQAFTAYTNPKGNADTERMMRTLKEELCWLREWSSANQLKTALDTFVTRNSTRVIRIRHSVTKRQMHLRKNTLKINRRLSIWRLD